MVPNGFLPVLRRNTVVFSDPLEVDACRCMLMEAKLGNRKNLPHHVGSSSQQCCQFITLRQSVCVKRGTWGLGSEDATLHHNYPETPSKSFWKALIVRGSNLRHFKRTLVGKQKERKTPTTRACAADGIRLS